MAQNQIKSAIGANGGLNASDIVNAKRKRMLLAEVYVHKARKMDTDTEKVTDQEQSDKFEVFHIYELEDNENTKITPKLSTNCTEPGKIIDVLENSTGSETPQLHRLIEKLRAQRKFCFVLFDRVPCRNVPFKQPRAQFGKC